MLQKHPKQKGSEVDILAEHGIEFQASYRNIPNKRDRKKPSCVRSYRCGHVTETSQTKGIGRMSLEVAATSECPVTETSQTKGIGREVVDVDVMNHAKGYRNILNKWDRKMPNEAQ